MRSRGETTPKNRVKFFSKRGYEIRHRGFSLKGVMRFVKKRQGPKIGTMGEV